MNLFPGLPPITHGPIEPIQPWLLESFYRLIMKRTGLDMKSQDIATLNQKIVARIAALNLPFPETYYQLLVDQTPASAEEWHVLAEQLTNPESFFFRDKGQVSALQHHILPALIQRRFAERKLRICSAGCANGEEAYSIAILLQALLPDLHEWDVKVVGIDLNPAAIARAQTGIYSSWSLRGLSKEVRQSYFHRVNSYYHVAPQFKTRVEFYPLNLVSDPFEIEAPLGSADREHTPLAALDLIVCRNVFIYFNSAAIAKVIHKFHQALRPSGYLLAGHSELHGQNLDLFRVQNLPESLVFQRLEKNNTSAGDRPTAPTGKAIPSKLSPTAPLHPPSHQHKRTDKRLESRPFSHRTVASHLLQQAQISLTQKAFHPALQQAKQALQTQPNNPKAFCLIAQAYADLHRTQIAMHYCHKALKADDCFIPPYYILAKIFTAQGNIAAAKRTLRRVIYLDPSAVVAYLELSHIYQQEGNLRKSDLMRHSAFDIFGKHLTQPD